MIDNAKHDWDSIKRKFTVKAVKRSILFELPED